VKQSKGTLVLDFDSTIISCESLEVLIEHQLKNHSEKEQILKKIADLTQLGMEGGISFTDSIKQRLELVSLVKTGIEKFAEDCSQWLTVGMADLIAKYQAKGVEVWIVSGGFNDILFAVGKVLKIPSTQIYGVSLKWDAAGKKCQLDASNPFCRSKVEGVTDLQANGKWVSREHPVVIVGDGYTDFQLYQAGLADAFIAFALHAPREKVMNLAKQNQQGIAMDVAALDSLLAKFF
jgi:phosphoserine phosphatase